MFLLDDGNVVLEAVKFQVFVVDTEAAEYPEFPWFLQGRSCYPAKGHMVTSTDRNMTFFVFSQWQAAVPHSGIEKP